MVAPQAFRREASCLLIEQCCRHLNEDAPDFEMVAWETAEGRNPFLRIARLVLIFSSSSLRPPKRRTFVPTPFSQVPACAATSRFVHWIQLSRGDVEIECANISQQNQQQQQQQQQQPVCTHPLSLCQRCYHRRCPWDPIQATEMSRSSLLTCDRRWLLHKRLLTMTAGASRIPLAVGTGLP
jgi:hypothetical protein